MEQIAEAWFGHSLARAAVVAGCLAAISGCDDARSGGAAARAFIGQTAPAVVHAVPIADADLRGAEASPDARRVANWAMQTNDHGARPFAVIDKQRAQVLVFSASGVLIGTSPALLGSARGDDTAPGVGDKPIDAVLPHERTTPAGRFVVERGINAKGKPVVWIDYDAAVSMHAVITNVPSQRRLERLASVDAADNRISYGCVNLPQPFFDAVALPAFQSRGGVVYVLPESRPLTDVFPALGARPDLIALRRHSEKHTTSAE